MKHVLIALAVISLSAGSAFAETAAQPSAKAMKLSQIISKVEGRDKYAYISELTWSQNGYYDIIYFTSDKAKVEIKVDPVSGEPQ
jgi:hypothetical protein